ncbi:major urinary protein-like [Macrotis lagotis]|uniref:major urinary protein-like n=1 Tax=Macrotis lagotis TaxID=92651 RepID=UPI003D6972FA
MKILLLTVGLVLVFGIKAQPNRLEDPKSLSGIWYTVGVCANVTSKIEDGGKLRLYVRDIRVHDDGNLSGTFCRKKHDEQILFHLSTFLGSDGERHFLYDGRNDFALESQGDQYAMFSVKNVKNDDTTAWGLLYGRTPDLPEEIKEKFQKMCIHMGTHKNQVKDLSNDGTCHRPI